MIKPGMGLVWAVSLLVLLFISAGYMYLREVDGDRDVVAYAGHSGDLRGPDHAGELDTVSPAVAPRAEVVATAGTQSTVATDAALDSPAVIKELDTITGDNDGHELVGRKVDLHVPVQGRANAVSFWVGEKDNRMLVVMQRDRRSAQAQQRSMPPAHQISPVHAGQQADIVGTIEKLPYREATYSWGLSTRDWSELASRPIYIRADSVTAEGHASKSE